MKYDKISTDALVNWLQQHQSHPYATNKEKEELALKTSLSIKQITTWLINARQKILNDE
jgi:hypothetical protein